MRKFIGTFIIALLFIGLLAYYYLAPREVEYSKYSDLVNNVKDQSIDEIELKSDKKTISINKENGKWYVYDDKKYLANQSMMDEAVRKLSGLKSIDTITMEDGRELSNYNLKDPIYTLNLKIGDKSDTLYIGNINLPKDAYFVKLPKEDDIIFKVGSTRFNEIMKPIDELRTKQIFSKNKEDIKEIELFIKEKLILKANYDNKWNISEESAVDVNEETMVWLIDNLKKINITDYFYEDITDPSFGFNNPEVKVSVKYKDDSLESLTIGGRAGVNPNNGESEVYAKRDESNVILTVPIKDVDFFNGFIPR